MEQMEKDKNTIPTIHHGGIDMLNKGYDRPSRVRVHRGIVTGETWKIVTMQRFTMQYDPPATANVTLLYDS